MFENMDLSKMSKMLMQAQEKANELESDLKNTTLSAQAGGGLVKVSAKGSGELCELLIDDSLLEDKDALSILIISAVNDVLKMIEDNKKGMAGNLFSGFDKI